MSSGNDNAPDLLLRDFAPKPMLRVEAHQPQRPRFPVFDAHNHLGRVSFLGGPRKASPPRPAEVLAIMDEAGVTAMVDLDGRWGDDLRYQLATFQEPYPDRFVVFAGFDYTNVPNDPAFGETEAKRLRESAAMGARGLKMWKLLGLEMRDGQGRVVPVDDERLDPLWAAAAELGLPVLIHIADPAAFFQPLDRHNERYEELQNHPDWHFYPTRPRGVLDHPDYPSFDEVIEQFGALLRRHPDTTFIGAHMGCCAEDLGWVGRAMDACPNFLIDISARIAELGRQPYTARDFFIRYQDRILFGTDATPRVEMYRVYYRFLETRDESFDYGSGPTPRTGRWQIYGLQLPDDVLRKVYYENAARVILRDDRGGSGPGTTNGAGSRR